MPDIRIETQGTLANVFVDGEEVGASAKGYLLTQRAGEMPTLHLFFNEEDFVDVGRIVELEKKVAELEEQVRAQPKDLDTEAIVELLERQIRETLAVDRQTLVLGQTQNDLLEQLIQTKKMQLSTHKSLLTSLAQPCLQSRNEP